MHYTDLEPHEKRLMAALVPANTALAEALKAGVPGTLGIGPERLDAEDDGCVYMGLSVPEADLNVIQHNLYEAAQDAVKALNTVIRQLDAEGHSVMLGLRNSRDAPLMLLGFAPRHAMTVDRE